MKKIVILSALILFCAGVRPALAEESTLRKAPQDEQDRFYNPWMKTPRHSFFDFLKWRFSTNRWAEEKKHEAPFEVEKTDIKALEKTGRDYIVWLGHSTVLIKAAGKRILTDPVFWDVNFLIKRKTPLPIDPENLPRIDYVLISHSHYDHMDTKSLVFLKEHFDPYFITGPGYGDYFRSIGSKKNVALNWTESYSANGLKITSLPVQHWSKRGLFDTNKMLWCSFMIESDGKTPRRYYWAGDSGYFRGFKEIGDKWGPFDVAMLPVGSYEPRWFMKTNHMNPAEAVAAAVDLRAKVTIPIHRATFDLTDEPLHQPVELLEKALSARTNHPKFKILHHGGAYLPPE